MVDGQVSVTTLDHDRPPVLEALPPELRREASPQRCVCPHCAPMFTDTQRAAHERVKQDWRAIRVAWCEAHGYLLVDLLRAELREQG